MRTLRIAAVLVIPLLLLGGCKKKEGAFFYESGRKESAEAPVKDVPKDILGTQQAFINLVKNVKPAVVNISTESKKKLVRPFLDLSPFGDFFGEDFFAPRYRKEKSLGSGFIINPEGYIVTNDHVVRDADSIQVKLDNGNTYAGRVVGSDPKTDLAVIRINADGKLPYTVLGDSEKLQVGQWAIAIGNPFGLDKTVTVGVISATGRSNMGIETYEDFIQTDASINPGNSGGPLLNVYGEVIGINTAIVASGQGIGFAIPVNMAKQVVAQLMKSGKVTRGWLGVAIQPITPELARSFGLRGTSGALVSDVTAGSPAAQGGLRQGDVILRFNGREVRDAQQLQILVGEAPVGKPADVVVFREGSEVKLKVALGSADSRQAQMQRPDAEQANWLGIVVHEVPREHRRGVPGVMIVDIDPSGVGAEGGLQQGDIIQSINQRRISSVAEYEKAMKEAMKRGAAALLVNRGGNSLYFAFSMR